MISSLLPHFGVVAITLDTDLSASSGSAAHRTISPSLRTYDVSLDGQRFLMIKDAAGPDQSASPPRIVVVQNWLEEVKRLVPAGR